jgi:putative lipoic acid-binding regulatory protein
MPSIDALAKAQQMRAQQKRSFATVGEGKGGLKKTQTRDTGAEEQRALDALNYPTSFTMKVIGVRDDSFEEDIINAIGECLAIYPETLEVSRKVTNNDKFVSITISHTFDCADDIYKVYAIVQADPRVKFCM